MQVSETAQGEEVMQVVEGVQAEKVMQVAEVVLAEVMEVADEGVLVEEVTIWVGMCRRGKMTQQAQDLELPELGTSKLILSIFRQLKKNKNYFM